MPRLILVLLFLALASTNEPDAQAPAPRERNLTPDSVARRVQERDTGRDSRAELRMRLHDRHGRVRERRLTLQTLSGGEARGDKMLLRFSSPADIRNTAFLVWEHPDAEDERFLYLPALGRVRRIAGGERQESFVGSDLTYEDVGGRDLADYTYAFTSENTAWVAPDGTTHEAWAVESRARERNAEYPRSVSLVLKDRFIVVHADIYNQRGERAKIFDVRRLEPVERIWTVLDMVVVNEQRETRTELTTTSIRYNVGLTEDDFTRRRLEQASAASRDAPTAAASLGPVEHDPPVLGSAASHRRHDFHR